MMMKNKGKEAALQEVTNLHTSSSSKQNPNSSTTIRKFVERRGFSQTNNKPAYVVKTPPLVRTSSEVKPQDERGDESKVKSCTSTTNSADHGPTGEEEGANNEEPELSEEQLTINNHLQEDELLAMEAIYGDNLTIGRTEGGQKSFQIRVHIETLGELTISAKLHSPKENVEPGGKSTSLIAPAQHSNEFLYTFAVQYLPPIVLTCLLPNSYPSHQPPYFTLSIQWLNSLRISNLCRMLDSFWTDKPGQEVIYQWVDWLHSSSLSHLGFDKEITLGPYNMPDAGDSRAFRGSVSPEVDIPSMMKYNDDKCHEVFNENFQECCICFSEHAGAEFIRLPCKHFFCWKCMETYSSIHVKEGTIYKLICPDAECDGLVPPGLLKRLLASEDFERWESLLLQKTLDSMSDVVYCPRCETGCLKDGDCDAQCPKCFFSFCILCGERRHVGSTCTSPEQKLLKLMEQQCSYELTDEQAHKREVMLNEILSLTEISRDAKRCPSCNIAISRTEGCNKMVCGNCGQFFCYQCNNAIRGYDHFRGGCVLFLTEETHIKEEENKVVVQMHPCPICAEENAKVSISYSWLFMLSENKTEVLN
ncbi:hypothetical protein IFM89_011165 [Coptis chinensis]|uniref:RBR-type E3 ubiquitin transferase n=1 Tax=Coptis chinensis TaxID=261450 RepID=A0A835LQZ6_9MAGN|nr:hypothetical protein IFM89_011165 [Coptis chinensis]